jgi:hypothetical protein
MLYTVKSLHIVALLVVVLTISVAARAQTSSLEGVYSASADQSERVNAAIEKAVAAMNFIKRPIARGRLKKTNPSYRQISIVRSDVQIEIQFDDRAPVQMPANGSSVKWTREDGETFDVNADWEEGRLVQTFKAEDGQRVNTFRLGPDGSQLSLHVAISSPQLPSPVEYTLVYERTTK